MKQALIFAYGKNPKQCKKNVELLRIELEKHNATEYFYSYFTEKINIPQFLKEVNENIDEEVNCIFISDMEEMFINPNEEIQSLVLELNKIGIDLFDQFEGNLTEKYTSVIKRNDDEWKLIKSKETKEKRIENTEMGKWTGGKTPFGYKLSVFKKLFIKDDEAKVVKEMFIQYSEGCSLNTIARIIGDKYDLKYKDGYWRARKIYDILSNPIYKGYYSFNKNTKIDGKMVALSKDQWKLSSKKDESIAIVNEFLFERVQGMLEKDENTPAYHKKKNAIKKEE